MLSFGERLTRKYLKKCFLNEKVYYNYRESGIVNDKTGMPLELDIFYPNLLIAFEFNGRQHKTDTEQKERDRIKKIQCKKLGILLITIWAKDLKKDMYKEIRESIFIHSNFKIHKPNETFLKLFEEKIEEYKKNIKKLHKKIKSKTFVKVIKK